MKVQLGLDVAFERISENIIVKSIRQGLMFILPLIMVGSFVLMLLNLPIDAINILLYRLFGEHWRTFALAIHKGTFSILSLSALIAISYAFMKNYNNKETSDLNPIIVVLTSLSCYIAFNPATEYVITEEAAAATGMLGAIVIAILSAYIFLLFYTRIPRKMKVYAYDADSILISSLLNIMPTMLTISVFSLARLVSDLAGFSNVIAQFGEGLNVVMSRGGGNIITALLYDFFTHIMWFFGIHGTNVMENLAQDVFVVASDINIALVAGGSVPTEVLTKEFFDVFVYLGGGGCTLGLLFALVIGGKSSNTSGLAKYSFVPGIFNINETVIYGLPVIFNPYYIVPFLLSPIALSISSYIAFITGLVPLTTARVVWTTPIFISGYVSTGSVAGIVLQLFNLCLAIAIYLPFVRLYERHISRNNQRLFQKLTDCYNNVQFSATPNLTYRVDELGMIARNLATEIRASVDGNVKDGLYMEFQPKGLADGSVYGAEALLRWNHPIYGNVSPLVVLGLADETGMSVELGAWVMETSFAQLYEWRKHGYDISLSVNISPKQLKEDTHLPDRVLSIMEKYKLDPMKMELELTENAILDHSITTRERVKQIKNMGINIAIDDFGMGSSSLLYLRDFFANVVKLDISLVRDIHLNVQNRKIVESIISLCDQLDVNIIAEGTEILDEIDTLIDLGCEKFQGWYFSKSLSPDKFIEYLSEHPPVVTHAEDRATENK